LKYDRVLKELKKDELVRFTREILRIPSVRRTGEYEEKVALYVARYLEEMGLKVTVQEVEPGSPNVIAVLEGGEKGPCLMFEAHTDVVTEGESTEWKHGPFDGKVIRNRIYGRGACDTKGNLAAAVMAVKAIQASRIPFKGKILLGILVDEEGLMTGVKHFIRKGWAKGVNAAIICEPEENHLCITQKGALRAEVVVTGRMSHGAMPLAGLNPVVPMVSILDKVRRLEEEEIARLGKDAFLGYPSFTPTVIQAPVRGEPQLNVVPYQCRALLDIRTVPGQEHGELKRRLARIVKGEEKAVNESLRDGTLGMLRESLKKGLSKDLRIEAALDVFEDRPWTKTAMDEPVVRAMARAFRKLTGKDPVYDGVPGATDGTFLNAWEGVPVITTGAGDRMVPHQKNEWVSIDELYLTAQLYALSALEFLNASR
jgi:succinyl-diaminopimelate desuccinylase